MKEIKFGRILVENRHKRGITQDALAAHIGVSKGAVSKWETGSSLPDISLLPKLASFFDISIDELIGYEPQMENSEIRKLYLRLTKDFSVLPFDEVLTSCLEIGKKYYSCYALLFQLGVLLVNHSAQAPNTGQTKQIIKKALEWFHRVESQAEQANLRKQALQMEAYCLLNLQRPSEVIDILKLDELDMGPSEPLLASAFQMTGNLQEAKKILQAGIYKEVLSLFNMLPTYLNLCLNDPEQFTETCLRLEQISDIFQMKALHPGILLGVYIAMAQGWAALGNTRQALHILEQYTSLAVSDIYPLRLHGDHFFTLLDEWFDNALTLGTYPPIDETLIRHSITQALSENPAFFSLKENSQFQAMIMKLKANEEEK